jgi:hypothetical protein
MSVTRFNVGVLDVANTLDNRPVLIDVGKNDFISIVVVNKPTVSTATPPTPSSDFDLFEIQPGITASNGLVKINKNPSGFDTITYSPNLGFVGKDTFSYLFRTRRGSGISDTGVTAFSDATLVTVTVGAITAPANFLGTSNQPISTMQALDLVNGPFAGLFPGLRGGQSPAEAGVAATSTAVFQSIVRGNGLN